MGTVVQPAISEALNQLWVKFQPQMEERVAALEEANRVLGLGSLSAEKQAAAISAAHKLAGVLGTFGLTEGTNLAREAEMALCSVVQPGTGALARLQEITVALSAMIRVPK